jgi:class 3 adenylate cyclase/streptogramin lyase
VARRGLHVHEEFTWRRLPLSATLLPMVARGRSSALVTVLFTDIVGSTEVAAQLGDRHWRELLSRHHRIVREELRRFGGREVDTAGDGFLAAFDQPAGAVRAAAEIQRRVQELGIDIRAGAHVGQAEVMGRQVGGVAVHIGARIAAMAGPAELLVSRTLTELVPGAGFAFEDRGEHSLKGVQGRHHLYAVVSVDGGRPPRPLDPKEATERREDITPPAVPRRIGLLLAAAVLVLGAIAIFFAVRDNEQTVREQDLAAGTLVRIDPSTNRVVATMPGPPIGGERGRFAIIPDIAAAGDVWVINKAGVGHVDTQSEEVTRITASRPLGRITVGHNAAWGTSAVGALAGSALSRIDPVSLEETHALTIGTQDIFNIPVGASLDSVWAGLQRTLIQVDPVNVEVVDEHRLEQAVDEIAATARDVWVVDRLARSLGRFDTEKADVVDTIELQTAPDAIAAGEGGDVWLVNSEAGTITPVRDGEIEEPIRVGSRPVDVAVGEDAVWVADQGDGTVTRIDRTFARVEEVIDVGAPVAAITVDLGTGDVWAYTV